MTAQNIAPRFRIEIRDTPTEGAGAKSSRWFVIDTAHTDEQAARKVEQLGTSIQGVELRKVANIGQLPPEEFSSLVDLRTSLIAEVGTDDVSEIVAKMRAAAAPAAAPTPAPESTALRGPSSREMDRLFSGLIENGVSEKTIVDALSSLVNRGAPPVVESGAPRADAPATAIAMPAPVPDATTGATPLPFEVGAILECPHTKGRVRVSKIFRVGDPNPERLGFLWDNMDAKSPEKTGQCPLTSVGAWTIVDDGKKGPAKEKVAAPSSKTAPSSARRSRASKAVRSSRSKKRTATRA